MHHVHLWNKNPILSCFSCSRNIFKDCRVWIQGRWADTRYKHMEKIDSNPRGPLMLQIRWEIKLTIRTVKFIMAQGYLPPSCWLWEGLTGAPIVATRCTNYRELKTFDIWPNLLTSHRLAFSYLGSTSRIYLPRINKYITKNVFLVKSRVTMKKSPPEEPSTLFSKFKAVVRFPQ